MKAMAQMREALVETWAHVTGRPRRLGFEAATLTDCGLVRLENQDSFAIAPEVGFFCVADGMGGGQGGALASRWTCDALQVAWQTARAQAPAAREATMNDALQAANGRIRAYAREQGFKVMGTTVVALLHVNAEGARARLFHVGDSRLYRLRYGRLDLLTRDHTVGNELGTAVATSDAARAKSLQARSNPLTHILTRAVGTEQRVRPDWKTVDVQRGDRLLLCSDGVHDMVDDADLGYLLTEADDPQDAVEMIGAAVRTAGAGDNYTLVCLDARSVL